MSPFCTGTLIGTNIAITAAHCFINNEFDESKVFEICDEDKVGCSQVIVGHQNILMGIQIDVADVFVHEEYFLTYKKHFYHHDIAILKLTKHINVTAWAKVAKLPQSTNEQLSNVGDILGWGHLSFKNAEEQPERTPYSMSYADVTIVNREDCQALIDTPNPKCLDCQDYMKRLKKLPKLQAGNICVIDDQSSSCNVGSSRYD